MASSATTGSPDRDLTTTRQQVFGDVEKGTECRVCGRDVEDGRSKTCSDYCGNLLEAVMGMLNWTTVRRLVTERDDEACQECGFKQNWIDRGHDHLREMCEEKLSDRPERPESLSLSSPDEWDEDELREYRDKTDQWREQKRDLIEEYFGRDRWLGTGWPSPESRLEVDHIEPISDGGHPFDPANLQTLCSDCHGSKTAQENSERAEKRTRTRGDLSESLFEYVSEGRADSEDDQLAAALPGSGLQNAAELGRQGSYRTACPGCESSITTSGVYCPYCGREVNHGE